MRLLLDANLSWRMIAVLEQHFDDCFILLKTGNQSKLFITNLLIQRKEDIESFSSSPELGLLEMVTK